MNKKAQLEMQETIIVIFIFIIILGIGLILFYQFNQASIKKINDNDKLMSFYNLLGSFPTLSEIGCSYLNDQRDCIDVSKLLTFKNKGVFKLSNITIYTIYPKKSNKECTLQLLNQNQDCGTFLIYNNIPSKCKSEFCEKRVMYTPVSLYYPDRDQYELGRLVIEVYL